MPDPRHELGRAGERLAEALLRKQGFKPVARGYTTPVGELDLVMRDGNTVVFVEVKARQDRRREDPEDAIRSAKKHRLVRAARWFLHDRKWEDRPARFDVVTVVAPPDEPPEINHIPDAFTLDEL